MKKTELSEGAMQERALAYEDAIEQIADAMAIPLIDAMAYRPELSFALDAFAARAVEAEREACAAICETMELADPAALPMKEKLRLFDFLNQCAAAIRERGKQ